MTFILGLPRANRGTGFERDTKWILEGTLGREGLVQGQVPATPWCGDLGLVPVLLGGSVETAVGSVLRATAVTESASD